jgi:hypothetical protein
MTIRSFHVTAALAASLCFAGTGAISAAPAPQSFDAAALAGQALAQVRGRLKLTDDQVNRIKPLLADHMTKLRQTLIDYSNPNGSMFPKLALEFSGTRDGFRKTVEPILSPDQMKEFMVIRTEVDRELLDAVCDARLAAIKERLALRAEQEKPVREILCEDFQRKRDLVIAAATPSGGQATHPPEVSQAQTIQDATEARLKQTLSADQMKAYEAYRDELKAKAQQRG